MSTHPRMASRRSAQQISRIAAVVLAVALYAPAGSEATPAAARPAPVRMQIAPLDSAVYAPTMPLPDGVHPVHLEDKDGQRFECKTTTFDPATCSTVEGDLFAKWGREGEARTGMFLRAEVRALPPIQAPSDSEWAKQAWIKTHGASQWREARLRSWRKASGRVAESEVQWGQREQDPAWGLSRYEERDGFVLFVYLFVAGRPPPAVRAELRRSFIDGPLGLPPAAGFSDCEAVEVTGAPPAEALCKRPRKLARADRCCVDPVEVAVVSGARVLLRVDACSVVPPDCAHVHGHGRMDARLGILAGPPPEVIVVEGGCELRAMAHGYVPSGVEAWTGCVHWRYRWNGQQLIKQ